MRTIGTFFVCLIFVIAGCSGPAEYSLQFSSKKNIPYACLNKSLETLLPEATFLKKETPGHINILVTDIYNPAPEELLLTVNLDQKPDGRGTLFAGFYYHGDIKQISEEAKPKLIAYAQSLVKTYRSLPEAINKSCSLEIPPKDFAEKCSISFCKEFLPK